MGKATVFFLVTCLFALTASLYCFLAGILTKGHSLIGSLGTGLGFALVAVSLYSACFRAHQVTRTVR